MEKILIAYYSFSKTTENLAVEIALLTNGEMRNLIPENPYSFDYNTATKEARSQIERGYCPKLIEGNESIEEYDTIFIGSPNWFKTIAPPVLSFLRKHDFSNKTIIPFCTHGGGGFGNIEETIKTEAKNANYLPGFAGAMDTETDGVETWLKRIELLKG